MLTSHLQATKSTEHFHSQPPSIDAKIDHSQLMNTDNTNVCQTC